MNCKNFLQTPLYPSSQTLISSINLFFYAPSYVVYVYLAAVSIYFYLFFHPSAIVFFYISTSLNKTCTLLLKGSTKKKETSLKIGARGSK